MQHHIASSKRAGLTPEDWKNLKNPSAAPFSDKEKTALAFAEKLTRTPQSITDSDIKGLKRFFSDAEVMELDLLVGLINLTNRFTDPLGLELEMAAVQICFYVFATTVLQEPWSEKCCPSTVVRELLSKNCCQRAVVKELSSLRPLG